MIANRGDSREICKFCGRTSPVGFYVPDDVWVAVVPRCFRNSELCLSCFTGWGDEKLIRWDTQIEFAPVSLVTSRTDFEPRERAQEEE